MRQGDWQAGDDAFGMLLCGAALHERDRWGEPRTDDSFLVLFHGRSEGCFVLPRSPEGDGWRRVLDSVEPGAGDERYEAGDTVRLAPDGLSVYQASKRSPAPARVGEAGETGEVPSPEGVLSPPAGSRR